LYFQEKIETDTIYIQSEDPLDRLDKLLVSKYPDFSRTYFQNLIEKGAILVNKKRIKKRIIPKKGDEIQIYFVLPEKISLEPEYIPFDILFEDEHILVINKKSGLIVHPGAGNFSHTFVHGLLYHCKELPNIDDSIRPGVVHRLDKETTGVLIAAKTTLAHTRLIQTFSTRSNLTKNYLAICLHRPENQTISLPIGRHPTRRKEMTTLSQGGKEAITHIQTIAYHEPLSLVLLRPITGRTHQIRVHLKSIHTPILGDKVYGLKQWNKRFSIERQLLHAYKLSLPHPIHKTQMEFIAPIPSDFKNIVRKILKEKSDFFHLTYA
jgi:23S rRNA pseudouridine1911/1915/1917 synthase